MMMLMKIIASWIYFLVRFAMRRCDEKNHSFIHSTCIAVISTASVKKKQTNVNQDIENFRFLCFHRNVKESNVCIGRTCEYERWPKSGKPIRQKRRRTSSPDEFYWPRKGQVPLLHSLDSYSCFNVSLSFLNSIICCCESHLSK